MGPSEPEPDSPTGTAVLRTTDSGDEWAVRLGPSRFDVLPEIPASPDALLEGTSTSLLLALWGRGADVSGTGEAALLEYLQS
jgi:hypothetical protein